MKISLLSAFYPYRGGIAQFGAMLYRALEEEHDVKAFTFKRQYPNFLFPGSSQYVTDEDSADEIPSVRVLDTVNPITYSTTARKINAEKPDLLISQYWMTFFGPSFGAVHRRVKKDVKRVSILHNVIPHEKRFFDSRANKYFLKHNDGFIVMSDAVLEDLLRLKPNAKYLRIDHPVYNQFGESRPREEVLKELNLEADKKYLLFFGFIRDYKGLDLLLEAMCDLPEDIHLIIAGEVYGSFTKYQQLIDANNLKSRVHIFDHYISDDEVTNYFSASDVCILPYKGATQSGITAISHHFEVPVVATDVGGLKENTKHNETGLIVEKPHPHLIANSIKHYYLENKGPVFRDNIKKIKEEGTWENFAKKIVEFAETL
jgi:glycosyltransferase involved in cell wall biosynthesis